MLSIGLCIPYNRYQGQAHEYYISAGLVHTCFLSCICFRTVLSQYLLDIRPVCVAVRPKLEYNKLCCCLDARPVTLTGTTTFSWTLEDVVGRINQKFVPEWYRGEEGEQYGSCRCPGAALNPEDQWLALCQLFISKNLSHNAMQSVETEISSMDFCCS